MQSNNRIKIELVFTIEIIELTVDCLKQSKGSTIDSYQYKSEESPRRWLRCRFIMAKLNINTNRQNWTEIDLRKFYFSFETNIQIKLKSVQTFFSNHLITVGR